MKVEIKIKERVSEEWINWFYGLEITQENNNTILRGILPDESALHGILNQIRDLNLKLMCVRIMEDE